MLLHCRIQSQELRLSRTERRMVGIHIISIAETVHVVVLCADEYYTLVVVIKQG